MKRGIILVELIFTIVIVSLISIFSMTLLYSLYEKFSSDYKNEIVKLESSSTNTLLDKLFSNTLNMKLNGSSITFDKEDTKLFNLGYYSRFVDLDSSNKIEIISPNTKAQYLVDYYITFDDTKFFKIKSDSFGEKINLESTESKEIKEQYKIVSKDEKINCEDNKLYYNGNTLLEDISECNFTLSSNILNISLKIDSIPFLYTNKL